MDDHPKTPLQAAPIHLLSKKHHKPCAASNEEIKLQLLSSYRKTAFLSILLSTATTLICGVTIPWAYSYVQYVDTVLTSQMDYCMHETTELWRLFSSTTTPTSEHVDINNPDVIQYRTTRSTGVTRKALLIKAGRRFRRLGLSTFSDRQKDSLADKWQITGFWHFGKFFPPFEEIIEREQQKEKQRENELRKRQVPEFEQTEAPRFWGSNPRLDRHLRDFFRHYHSLRRKHEFLMDRSGRDPRRSESYPSLLNRRAIPPFDSFFENSRGNSRPPTSSPKDIFGRPIPSTMAPKPESDRRFSRQPTSGRFGGTLIQERLPVDLAPANPTYNPSTTAIPVSGYVDREAPAPPTIRPEHFSLSYARPAPTKYRPTYPQTQTTAAYPGPAQKPISPSPLTGNGRNPRPGAFVSGGSGARQEGSSGCCTCHQGPAGPPGRPGVPGHNGRDGKSGIDGPPGLNGDELLEITRRTQQNGYAPKPCVPTCEPALPGLPGYPGYKGRKGPRGDPGDPGYGGKEGPPGERGQAGSKGKHGKRGLPGIPGIPGEITVGRLPAGQPGPQGRPGPYGAAGLPGFDGKAALPGKPGPRGPVGETGAPGTPGDYGRPGPTGLRGTVGDCSHCPPPRFPPGYFVQQTLPVEHISPAGPPPLPNFPPTPAPRRDTVAPMPATYPPTAAPPSWIPTPTTVAPLYPATRAPPPELEYAAPPRTAPPGNQIDKNNGYANPLGTVAPPSGSGHHTVPGTTRRYSSNSAEWLNLLPEQQQQQQPSREITHPLGLPVPRPPNALFNIPPTGAFEVVYDDVPAGIPHEWDMYSHAMQHNPYYGHVPWYQSIYSRRQLGVPGFEKSKS